MSNDFLVWVPVGNSFALLVGYIYGMAVLKTALKSMVEQMERLAKQSDDHEHRITLIEGRNATIDRGKGVG